MIQNVHFMQYYMIVVVVVAAQVHPSMTSQIRKGFLLKLNSKCIFSFSTQLSLHIEAFFRKENGFNVPTKCARILPDELKRLYDYQRI